MSDERHGELDEGAAYALDELLAMVREIDADIDVGEMMSRAIRLHYAVCTGGVTIVPSPELLALEAAAGPSAVPDPASRH